MTYSLNTLNSSRSDATSARSGWVRFANEIGLLFGLVWIILWLTALLTYSPQDVAWSTSGSGNLLVNRAGRVGAWLADASYFVLGYSVWWCVAASIRAWLSGLALWLRGSERLTSKNDSHAQSSTVINRFTASRAAFWLGLILLLCASANLEWSRFYSLEGRLPGHSGGMLGYLVGPLGVKWLGFAGTGLIAILVGLVGAALVFRFSWGQVAERLGGWLYFQVESRREKREVAQDIAMGQQAVRAREENRHLEEREETAAPQPRPAVMKPVQAAATRSEPVKSEPIKSEPTVIERVVKERPAPVFKENADNNLPQVSLLDDALVNQETVAPETLEMTSRMIEKKLKDFGVDVRVVLAQPGPVITRYEIEPATGVKGSQIVGLAKDLARSLSLVSIRVVETIPGKNYMALELPNAKRQSIKLSEILGSPIYHEAKSMLTMGLGKDIIGNPVVVDLAKMPHVLVAGTTGSGKSVGINAMILSLLYKAEAHDVRIMMIDPKMLEMSVYEGIPHLLCPVVTDMKQAAYGLSCVSTRWSAATSC